MLYINSDASVYKIGEHKWLTGCGLFAKDYSKSIQLGLGTVNTAEFSGILNAAYLGIWLGEGDVTLRSDSQVCVKMALQVNRTEQFSNYVLAYSLLEECYRRMGRTLRLEWIPREQNSHADGLARKATAAYKKAPP